MSPSMSVQVLASIKRTSPNLSLVQCVTSAKRSIMASDQTPSDASLPSGVPHPPRKRAAGPRFDNLPEFRAAPEAPPKPVYSSDPVERIAQIKEPRIGPLFIKYSVWAGGAAIAYTYLTGFRALYHVGDKQERRQGSRASRTYIQKHMVWLSWACAVNTCVFTLPVQKDRPSWIHTFRQRIWIMSPLIAMYVTGTNMIPMPFRSSIEQWLGRPAITLQDMHKAVRALRKEQQEALQKAQQSVSDVFADKHAIKSSEPAS